MNSLNSIILEGNLVRKPNAKFTPNGAAVTTFTIASNRFFKEDDKMVSEASYFDIECWGRLARTCAINLDKGRGVRVVGRVKQDRWTDADGLNHSRVKIVADHVEPKPLKSADPTLEKEPLVNEEEAYEATQETIS